WLVVPASLGYAIQRRLWPSESPAQKPTSLRVKATIQIRQSLCQCWWSFSLTRPPSRSAANAPDPRGSENQSDVLPLVILRDAVAEALHEALIAAPVLQHLDVQIEEDLGVELIFEVCTRLTADLLDHRALLADHDALLGITLDVNRGADVMRAVLAF